MLKNYFKTALRNLWKKKSYSSLNIFGLAIGIACAGLIFLWVEDELHYNNYNLKKAQLYSVKVNENYSAGILTNSSTPGLLGPAIGKDIPGIVNTCRRSEGTENMLFTIGEKKIYTGGCYAEASLFSMFTLPFVEGNPKNPFPQVHSIVLTEKTAKKFFGHSDNVLGKTLNLDNKQDYIVSGVLKDLPENSSLQFDWVAPFEIYYKQSDWLWRWENNSLTTYVQLDPGADVSSVNKQLANYIQRYVPKSITHLFLFAMKDWRLYNEFENGKQTGGGRIVFVRLFALIAWIILLIACINFMNLATARSEKRAKEVGVRKVLGARKNGLILQFIGEALFMALLAAIAAGFVISLTLPGFNDLVHKNLSLGLDNPLHVLALLGIMLICGIVAGSYPSLYLSSFNPVSVLKGLKIKTGGATFVRKGLVVFQFAISIVLIICTIIIYQQIQHARNRQMGFDRNNLIEVTVHGDMKSHFAVIRQDLLNTGLVENAAISDHETIYGGNNTDGASWEGMAPGTKVLISYRSVSPEFMNTSGMKVLEGRDFIPSDSIPLQGRTNMIITQSLAKMMGKGSAVGKIMRFEGDTSRGAAIVGVVNDYVYGNMYGQSDPVVFIPMQPAYTASVMYIRLKRNTDPTKALAGMEKVMRKDNPLFPFDYRFVNDQFNAMFQGEMLIGELSRIFAALAILISCLGLFGLAAYTAERRTKEIGIRKVLGASVSGITGLLSKDFMQLIGLSAILAFPVAWWTMHHWLQNYNYRISINAWVFVLAGAMAMIVAMGTIIYQAIRAATANPVTSLRS